MFVLSQISERRKGEKTGKYPNLMKKFISRQGLLLRTEDFPSFIIELAILLCLTESQVLNLGTLFICEMGFEQLDILQA